MKLFFTFLITTIVSVTTAFTQYTLTTDDVLFYEPTGTIVDYTNTEKKDIVIPASLNGAAVKIIGEEAFMKKGLTSVVIPNSVEKIETKAFNNNALTSVIVPNSVTIMESSAFWRNQISSLTLSNSLTVIEAQCFSVNKLTSVTIPAGITEIKLSAFRYNDITSIAIPEGATYIGSDAFGGNEITTISLPESVTFLGHACFNENKIREINGKTSTGIIFSRYEDGSVDSTYIVSFGGTATVIDFIPNTVTNIGRDAFMDNDFITNVVIPNSVKIIGNYAFARTRMTSLTLGNSVESIGGSAFWYCQLSNVVLPTSIQFIGTKAFFSNTLTKINLPSTVDGLENAVWKDGNGFEVSDIQFFELYYRASGDIATYTVTFNDWDGSLIKNETVEYGEVANAPVNPTRTGYVFNSWDNGFSDVKNNLVVTAQYDIISSLNNNEVTNSLFYPNPVCDGNFTLTSPSLSNSIKIIDHSGNLVLENTGNSMNIDISDLVSGVYFITINNEVNKLIVE